jgi:hypothetical protein
LPGTSCFFARRTTIARGASRTATSQLILSSTMLFDWNAFVDGASAHVNFGANVQEAALPDCYMRASEKASILV